MRVIIGTWVVCLLVLQGCTTVKNKIREDFEMSISLQDKVLYRNQPIFLSITIKNNKKKRQVINDPAKYSSVVEIKKEGTGKWVKARLFTMKEGSANDMHLSDAPLVSIESQQTLINFKGIIPCQLGSDFQIADGVYQVRVTFYPGKNYSPVISKTENIIVRTENSDKLASYIGNLSFPCFLYDPEIFGYMLTSPDEFQARKHVDYIVDNFPQSNEALWAKLFLIYNEQLDIENLDESQITQPFIKERYSYLKKILK